MIRLHKRDAFDCDNTGRCILTCTGVATPMKVSASSSSTTICQRDMEDREGLKLNANKRVSMGYWKRDNTKFVGRLQQATSLLSAASTETTTKDECKG